MSVYLSAHNPDTDHPFRVARKYGDYSHVTVEEWKPILRYAHKWGFPEVKALAIRFLEGNKDLGTAERIVLYQENKIPGKYLLPHFTELVCRENYLGLEESHTLGVENLWLIFQARERLRVHSNKDSDHPSPLRKGINETEIKDIVVSTFKISLTEEEPTPGSTVSLQPPAMNLNALLPFQTLNDRMKDFAAGRNETVPGYQCWEDDSDLGDEDSEDWDESSSDIESLESEAWDDSTNFPGSFPS